MLMNAGEYGHARRIPAGNRLAEGFRDSFRHLHPFQARCRILVFLTNRQSRCACFPRAVWYLVRALVAARARACARTRKPALVLGPTAPDRPRVLGGDGRLVARRGAVAPASGRARARA